MYTLNIPPEKLLTSALRYNDYVEEIDKLLKEITDTDRNFGGKDQPTHLYHYTSADSLKKIIDKTAFWLFDIRYMNDEAEYTHIFDFAEAYADISGRGGEDAANRTFQHIIEGARSDLKYSTQEAVDIIRGNKVGMSQSEIDVKTSYSSSMQLYNSELRGASFYFNLSTVIKRHKDYGLHKNPLCYIASFSEKRDSLSQWRGYCPQGGYSLGFDIVKFSTSVSPEFILGKCIYDVKKKERLLRQIFSSLKTEYDAITNKDINPYNLNNLSNSENQRWSAWTQSVTHTLARFAPFFKHDGFEEEAEWRFVNASAVFPNSFSEPDQHFHPVSSTLRPYTIMTFPNYNHGASKAIEVTVGPMNQQQLAKDSMKDFLRQHMGPNAVNYKFIEKSSIPYRT